MRKLCHCRGLGLPRVASGLVPAGLHPFKHTSLASGSVFIPPVFRSSPSEIKSSHDQSQQTVVLEPAESVETVGTSLDAEQQQQHPQQQLPQQQLPQQPQHDRWRPLHQAANPRLFLCVYTICMENGVMYLGIF